MVNIKNKLSLDDVKEIEQEIESIEYVTSGEIVPVIAAKSSSYRTVQVIDAVVLSYVFMLLVYAKYNFINLAGLVLCPVLALCLIFILSRFEFFKRILIPRKIMAQKVHAAAMMSFYRNGVHRTENMTGILIYVSLMERMVVVIGDEGIHHKVGDDAWTGVIKKIIGGIKSKKLKQGVVDGIESCRDLLKIHFPAGPINKNELSNKVIYE